MFEAPLEDYGTETLNSTELAIQGKYWTVQWEAEVS